MPLIELPNKKYFRVPEGLSDEEAIARAQQRFPELYGKGQGFVERMGRAAMRGLEQPIESLAGLGLGARAAVGDIEGAQRQMESIKREAAEEAKRPQGLTVEQLQDIYRTQGLGSMLGKVPAYVGEQVLQNVPSMAVPLAAGAYGTAAAGPVGGLAAGIGTYGLQQLGSFMQRQAAEKQRAEELEPVKAALTTAVTAPVGFLVDRFALGLGKAGSKAGEAVARELAARSAGRTVATGAAKSVLSEVPTELLETAAERYQAGLSLTDDKAKSEYINTIAGTVAATGPIGGGFAYRAREQARERVAELDSAKRIQEQLIQQQTGAVSAEEQKTRSENLFQERIPLLERSRELRSALKAKDLDPEDALLAKQELEQIARRVSDINSELKKLGVVTPAAKSKRSLEEILSERRAAEERFDEFGNRIRSPQEVAAEREKAAQPYYEEQLKAARKAALQRQVEDIEAGYVPEQVPASVTPKDRVLEAQLRFQEQYDSAKDAAQKRAAEAEAKRRGFIVDDFGNVVPGKEIAEQALSNQKISAARSKTLQTFTPKELQEQIDTGYVTPAVQKFLGISLPERKESIPAQGELPTAMGMGAPSFEGYNLNQRDQAEAVLPVLQQRLDELASIKNLFIGEPLTSGTKPTAQAKRLFEVEAQIKELNRLKSIAESAPVKLDQDFGKIRQRLNTLKEQSNNVLEDEFFEPVTRLRAGETQEGGAPLTVGARSTLTSRTKYVEQANAAIQKLQDAAVEQANLQRTLNGYGPIGRDQEISLRMRVKQALERVTSSVSAPLEKNAEMAQRVEALAQRTKDAGAVELLNKAQGLFAQNNSSNALIKAAENVLKRGVTPGTLTQLQRAIKSTLIRRMHETEGRVGKAVPNVKTDYAPILKAIDQRIQTARNAGVATEDPRMQTLLREYSNITQKQKQQQTTPERGIAEPEKQTLRSTIDKAVADAAKVKVVKRKGAFALAPQTRRLEEKREAERRGETEPTLAEGKDLQDVRKRIKNLIAIGAKRSDVGDLTSLLSTKFKVSTPKEQQSYQEKLVKLAALEKKLMDSAGAGELVRFRKYVADKIDTALTRPNIPADVRKALEMARERFIQGKGTRTTTVKKVSEALIGARIIEGLDVAWRYDKTTNRFYAPELEGGKVEQISYNEFVHGTLDSANALADSVLLGRPESPNELNDALAREREAVEQHETQRELFVEPAREDQARPDLFTAIKRSTPEKFRAFQAALKRRTDWQIEQAVAQSAMSKEVRELKQAITDIKTRMASLFEDAKVAVQRSESFSTAVQEQVMKVRETFAESGVLETDEVFTKALDKALKPLEPVLTRLAEQEATIRYRDMSSALLDYQGQVQALQNAAKSNLQLGNFQNRLQRESTNLGVLLNRITKKRLELEEAERRAQIREQQREQRKAEQEKLAAAKANLRAKGIVRTVLAKDVSVEKLNEVLNEKRELQQLRQDKTLSVAERRNINEQLNQLRNQEHEIRVGLLDLAKTGRLETRLEESSLEGKEGRSNEEIAEERKAFLEEARQSQERALSARLRKLTAQLNLVAKETDAVANAFAKQRQAGKSSLQGVPEPVSKKFSADMRKLKAKRTRIQTKIAKAIDLGLRSGASFEMSKRMALPDLDRAIASVTEQLKTATPAREATLNKERQELMSLATAINDAVVVSKREKTAVQYKERIPAAKRQKGGQTEEEMKKTAERQRALAEEKERLLEIELRQLAIDIEKNDPDLRAASSADAGVALEQASKVAERVRAAIPKEISVTYVATQDALPSDLKAAIARMGVDRIKGAVMPDGRVFVVGENHKTVQDVEETFAHELIGHYGVDMVLGPKAMKELTERLFAKGDKYVADLAQALGVFPDVASALSALGYTKPTVDLTRRRLVQAAGAAMVKPVMPAGLSDSFNVTDPEKAVDAIYNIWDNGDGWIDKLIKKIPVSLHKEAEGILHTKIHDFAGRNFYNAWTNQGENFVAVEYIEEAIEEKGFTQLLKDLKRAYDVAAGDIVKLALPEQSVNKEAVEKQKEQTADLRMAVVREMIAHAAEGRRVAPGMVDRVKQFVKDIVNAVRGFFKRFGMDSLVKQDTKYIYNLIKQAERDLATSRLGAYTSPNGDIAFKFGAAKMPAGFEKVQEFDQKITAQSKGLSDRILSGGLLGAKVTYVDQLAAWEELAKKMGDKNAAMQMMYYFQKSLDLLPMSSASAYIGNLQLKETEPGVFTIAAEKGPSLRSVDEKLKPLLKMGFNAEGANRLFTAYMASLRGEVEGYNKLQFSEDKIQLIKDAVAAIRANEKVKAVLDDAREDYNAYNKGLVNFLEKSGAISPELAQSMRSKRDYIPYYRATRDGVLELFLDPAHPVKVGNLKDSPHLEKLVGGDTPILDYFTSSMQNTMLLTDMALRNLSIKNAAFTMNKLGLLEPLRRNDKEYGIRNGPGPQSADVLRFKDKGDDKHVVLRTQGTAFEDIPVDLLAKGLEGVAITVPDWLKLLALPAKVLRKGVTLSPLYPYYQLFKDSLAMGATRGNSYSNTINVLSGMKNYINGKKMMEELQSKGVVSGQMFTGNMEDVAQFRRQILKGQGPIHSAMAWQESRALNADAAVRKMLFDSYIRQGLNQRDAEYMTITAMPYNRKGLSPGLRYLSHMIPFFNAQIVGLHSLYQGFRGKTLMEDKLQMKKKLWTAGMWMGLSTLVYASMVGDEDWYKKMPLETRMRNWLIKLPDVEEPIAIPIPFEFGILFKGLWEGAYLGMFNSSPEGKKVREAVKSVLINTIPGGAMPIPTAALPLLELKANKSFFNDAPIESTRDLAVDPAQRFSDGTSELAKSLGEATDMSPKQIDHLIRGYTGPMGVAVAALISAFTGSESAAAAPEKPLSKYPVLGQLFKTAEGNELVDLAMDTLKEAEQMNKTYTRMLERGDMEKAEAYLQENVDKIAKGRMAGKLVQVLGQFAAAERSIVADKEMTPIEKRDRIKELRQTRSRIAENYQQAAMSGG